MIQSLKGIRVGATVHTTKGSKETGPFSGEVVGFGKSIHGKTVNLRKHNGQVVYCLLENIQKGTLSAKGKEKPGKEPKKPKKPKKK